MLNDINSGTNPELFTMNESSIFHFAFGCELYPQNITCTAIWSSNPQKKLISLSQHYADISLALPVLFQNEKLPKETVGKIVAQILNEQNVCACWLYPVFYLCIADISKSATGLILFTLQFSVLHICKSMVKHVRTVLSSLV